MKKIYLILPVLLFACGADENEKSEFEGDPDFRQEMRNFVIGISDYAKAEDPGFVIIPQNGIELVTTDGDPGSNQSGDYLTAIDGNGQEDLFYGYDKDDVPSPTEEIEYLTDLLNVSKNAGNTILVTDYCSTSANMDNSYQKNQEAGYISFAADERELFNIPGYPDPIYEENANEVTRLSQAKNFLYLINPETFTSKTAFINAVTSTNYDLVIIDLFFHDGVAFTTQEIESLKSKANGGSRLVICYMSIGEAEDYRYYWKSEWNSTRPDWMDNENPDWEGNFKVRYWDPEWQAVIYGGQEAYLDKILSAGFDGVYLDIIDAFEFFE